MQNTNGQKAVLALGVQQEHIEVIGDPKYDALQPINNEEIHQLCKSFNLKPETPVWIAGSTHAGEEEIILDAHRQLLEKHPDLVLILAPRRMERVEEVTALVKKKELSFSHRSLLDHTKSPAVILLDTMGELAKVYSLGQLAFIGNSLIKPGGGHSLIEPLSYGLPVLHGPYVENIGHVSEKALSKELAFKVENFETLEQKVHTLLENKSQRLEIAEKANTFIADHQGASKKMAEIIKKYL